MLSPALYKLRKLGIVLTNASKADLAVERILQMSSLSENQCPPSTMLQPAISLLWQNLKRPCTSAGTSIPTASALCTASCGPSCPDLSPEGQDMSHVVQ